MYKEMLPTFHRYLFTWFSLISLAQQGVYDVVSSFGAMAARLIFSKVEEAAYFYFSQTVSRGRPKVLSVTNSVLCIMFLPAYIRSRLAEDSCNCCCSSC